MKRLDPPFQSSSPEVIAPDHAYEYVPLATTGEGEIRLMRLWTGPVESKAISLEIFHAMKASRPIYEALSYAWGSAAHTNFVLVREAVGQHGKRKTRSQLEKNLRKRTPVSSLGIAHNLAIALRHLRYPDRERILWVDAICINQTDEDEKSREVARMGSIYSSAQQVIVWLGPCEDDSTLALETLRRIGADVEYDRATHTVSWAYGSWAHRLTENTSSLQAEVPKWVAIGKLSRRDWFSRLWVYQEIVLATASIVVVGVSSLDWELFRLGTWWISTMTNKINLSLGRSNVEMPSINHMYGLLRFTDRTNTTPSNLLMALEDTKHLLCCDDRDRLFAIRGLLRASEQQIIRPDYTLPVEEVYKATTISWIESDGGLNILQRCVLPNSPPRFRLPSWVPDFSHKNLPTQIAWATADGHCEAYFAIERDTLVAQGVLVGQISEALTSQVTEKSTDKELVDVLQIWTKQLSLSSVYVAGGLTEDAFIEAIMGGAVEEKSPVNAGRISASDSCKRVLVASRKFDEESKGMEMNEPDRLHVLKELRRFIRGRAFFRTANGYMGMYPESVKCGDVVVVLLGCYVPLVLRPGQGSEAAFSVVGECYVPGMMNTEALIGSLPREWTQKSMISKTRSLVRIYEHGNIKTQQDPRASALPPGWRVIFGTLKDPLEEEPEDERDWEQIWFENLETGEKTHYDPRLALGLLRKQGVDIQEFKIV